MALLPFLFSRFTLAPFLSSSRAIDSFFLWWMHTQNLSTIFLSSCGGYTGRISLQIIIFPVVDAQAEYQYRLFIFPVVDAQTESYYILFFLWWMRKQNISTEYSFFLWWMYTQNISTDYSFFPVVDAQAEYQYRL